MTEFQKLVEKLEEHLGEKAVFKKYNDSTGLFEAVPFSEHNDEEYNVYVAGYNVKDRGSMILKYNMQKTKSKQVLKWEEGYYGFSHRSGATFNIGDMLFDENFKMTEKHPKYEAYYEQTKKDCEDKEHWNYGSDPKDIVMDYVIFKERGDKVIETEEEAFQAALNFAKFIS